MKEISVQCRIYILSNVSGQKKSLSIYESFCFFNSIGHWTSINIHFSSGNMNNLFPYEIGFVA